MKEKGKGEKMDGKENRRKGRSKEKGRKGMKVKAKKR